MTELKLGVGLLPDETTRRLAIEMSQKLQERYDLSYDLNGIDAHPHLTLFQNKFQEIGYSDVVTERERFQI